MKEFEKKSTKKVSKLKQITIKRMRTKFDIKIS
jgi:DNA-binding transcriptional regulator YiaG